MTIQYTPRGTCSRQFQIEVEEGVIQSVQVVGGCDGNLKGLSSLLKGMNVEEAIGRMEGIRCGMKPTSCPDQLALALEEKLAFYDDYVKSGAYANQDRFSNFDRAFGEFEGKTWGIVGMGNIGGRVAKVAQALGCKVIFYSASGKSSCTEYERVELDELLKQSDILSLHCPLSDRTRGLINKEAFSKMKKTAVLVNVARGPVVDTEALYEALTQGRIAAAGLDVLEKEPISKDNPLGKIKDSTKLIITPHMAWASTEARERLVEEVGKNIQAFLDGEDRNVVNK